MAKHDFGALYAKYPVVIRNMPEVFTSHEFILELARRYQKLYVEALYSYRDVKHREAEAPFMMVHGVLALHLLNYPTMIKQVRRETASKNIFGEDDTCSEWERIDAAA